MFLTRYTVTQNNDLTCYFNMLHFLLLFMTFFLRWLLRIFLKYTRIFILLLIIFRNVSNCIHVHIVPYIVYLASIGRLINYFSHTILWIFRTFKTSLLFRDTEISFGFIAFYNILYLNLKNTIQLIMQFNFF